MLWLEFLDSCQGILVFRSCLETGCAVKLEGNETSLPTMTETHCPSSRCMGTTCDSPPGPYREKPTCNSSGLCSASPSTPNPWCLLDLH